VPPTLPAALHAVLSFRRLSRRGGERCDPEKKAKEAGGGERLHERWIHGFPAKEKRAVEGGGSLTPGKPRTRSQDIKDTKDSKDRRRGISRPWCP